MDVCFVQVYSQLPLQKLSGYAYEVEDFEPYPCFSLPIPGPRPALERRAELEPRPELEPQLEPEPEPSPVPEIVLDAVEAGRPKRSFYFEPPNQKNDVYSIFKV